jgi:hypothetical protein
MKLKPLLGYAKNGTLMKRIRYREDAEKDGFNNIK